jgi:hypothetical protein
MSLLPREAASEVDCHAVRWLDGDFWHEFRNGERSPRSAWASPAAPQRRKLVPGDTFTVGTTRVEFECSVRSWSVDLTRERELLARDDAAAWSIYADELLAKGDPLGGVLAKTGEFDLGFHLDVSPLLSRGFVSFSEERGLWREVTFRYSPFDDEEYYLEHEPVGLSLDAGKIEAVLSHPRAWFARRVVLELPQYSEEWAMASIRGLVNTVSRSGGHFIEVLTLPNFPRGEPLPTARDGVRVDRG